MKTVMQPISPPATRNGATRPIASATWDAGPGVELAPRWKRILVPVDFSLPSMKALSYASWLAESLGASLDLIHVLAAPPLAVGIRTRPLLVGVGTQQMVDAAHAKLLAVAKRRVRAGVATTRSVRIGEPEREVLGAAARLHSDALLLHTEVESGLDGFLRNGTTHRILFGAPCPVLLLPNQILWPADDAPSLVRPGLWRRILIPVEMTAVGAETLFRGVALAQWYNARVTVCNVLRTGRLQARYRSAHARNRRLLKASEAFGTWLRRCKPPGVGVETYLGEGRPAPSFLQAARDLKAQVIVLGTQQFSGWRRYRAAGAVSRILATTPCPILSVPQPPGGGLQSATARGPREANDQRNEPGMPS